MSQVFVDRGQKSVDTHYNGALSSFLPAVAATVGGGTDLESREMRPLAAAVVSAVSHWCLRPGLLFIQPSPDCDA